MLLLTDAPDLNSCTQTKKYQARELRQVRQPLKNNTDVSLILCNTTWLCFDTDLPCFSMPAWVTLKFTHPQHKRSWKLRHVAHRLGTITTLLGRLHTMVYWDQQQSSIIPCAGLWMSSFFRSRLTNERGLPWQLSVYFLAHSPTQFLLTPTFSKTYLL